jgi:hypothetical protein
VKPGLKNYEPPQPSWVAVLYTVRNGRKGNRKGSIRWKFAPRHMYSSSAWSEEYRTEEEAVKACFKLGYGAVKTEAGKIIKRS